MTRADIFLDQRLRTSGLETGRDKQHERSKLCTSRISSGRTWGSLGLVETQPCCPRGVYRPEELLAEEVDGGSKSHVIAAHSSET
jgi:hypothetical protein